MSRVVEERERDREAEQHEQVEVQPANGRRGSMNGATNSTHSGIHTHGALTVRPNAPG